MLPSTATPLHLTLNYWRKVKWTDYYLHCFILQTSHTPDLSKYSPFLSASANVCVLFVFPFSVLHPSVQKRTMTTSQARTAPTSPAPGTSRPPLSVSHQPSKNREQEKSSTGQTAMIQMNQRHKDQNKLLVHMVRFHHPSVVRAGCVGSIRH